MNKLFQRVKASFKAQYTPAYCFVFFPWLLATSSMFEKFGITSWRPWVCMFLVGKLLSYISNGINWKETDQPNVNM